MKTKKAYVRIMKASDHFVVDFIEGKIIGTKTAFNKASRGINPYYEELTSKINTHPTYSVEVRTPQKRSNEPKRTYKGINYKFMENYISIQRNATNIMEEYKAVKEAAKDQGFSVFHTTLVWFLGEFDPNNEGFDVKKANRAIIQALINKAVLSVPHPESVIPINELEDPAA